MLDMSTEQILAIKSSGLDDTSRAASELASKLQGNEVIELRGDVGAGKTTFVKGLVKALGSSDEVASPSFTVSRQYKLPNENEVHHFDFYRLTDPGIMTAEIKESIDDERVVVVIEWGDIVENVLPEARIVVELKVIGEDSREINVSRVS